MKTLGSIIRVALKIALSFAVVVVLLSLTVWSFPGLVVNRSALQWLTALARTQGVHLYWGTETQFSIESISWAAKRIRLSTNRLCFSLIDPIGSGCFSESSWQVDLKILPQLRLARVGPIRMLGGRLTFKENEVAVGEVSTTASTPNHFHIPDFLRELELDTTRIEVKSFRYRPARGKTVVGSLDLSGDAVGTIANWKLNAMLDGRRLQLNGQSHTLPGQGTDYRAKGKVEIPGFQGSFSTNAQWREEKFTADFYTSFADLKGKLEILYPQSSTKSKLTLAVSLADFRKYVEDVRHKSWAVPSPFNELEGQAEVIVKSEGEFSVDRGSFPFQVETSLTSSIQRFRSTSEGTFSFDGLKKFNLQAGIDLSDIQLVLPPLQVASLPRLAPDTRFHTNGSIPENQGPPAFTFEIQIKTQPGHPLRLVTASGKTRVPVEVDFKIGSSGPASGTLRITPFPIEVFKRRGTVKYFTLRIKDDVSAPEVDGRLEVKTAQYRISILLLGDVERPKIVLQSHPPLSEEDTISVLLFGRTYRQLPATQEDSVANIGAAAANRAFTLASMYLLASTPIESVVYDPVTNTFSAMVRIADGTTIDVGTNLSGVEQLSLRQRIAPNWHIHTLLVDPFQADDRTSATAFVEWSRRY